MTPRLAARSTLRDITLELCALTPVYPGDPAPALERTADLARGDPLTSSHLSIGCHVGTHVDAPAHFLADGALLGDLSLARFYGPATVLDLRGRRCIEPDHLRALPIPRGQHLLLHTDGSRLLQRTGYSELAPYLCAKAAEHLCSLEPLSVGFDSYSLDPPDAAEPFPAHTALARAGIPVFVCLALDGVPAGPYTFAGLPLRLAGAEAAPVRALLIEVDCGSAAEP
jgi:arylformamidase